MQKTLKRYFPIFVLPTLIAFSFAFIIPFVMGVYLSFCKFKTITKGGEDEKDIFKREII